MLPFIQSTYLAALLESFHSGVLILNVRGDVYAANETAGAMLGLDREDLLAGSFREHVLPGVREKDEALALFERIRDGGEPGPGIQTTFDHPALGPRHVTLTLSRLVEYGKVFGIVAQLTDVTPIYEMHRREKDMLEEQARLQRERIASLDQLSMALAHQMRNPLMSIAGFARILERKGRLDEYCTEALRAILDGAGRLEEIVRAVTCYTASRPLERVASDLGGLAREALRAVEPLPGGVRVECAPHWPCVQLDPRRVRDALAEVLRNAVEACIPAGGAVRVVPELDADGPGIVVTDQGPGIDASILPFLFDPFFTTKAVGVGMGLPKARRWMREMGGDVAIRRIPGGGTMAILRFPAGSVLKGAEK
ncbi:Globin-coupled histidine kinase [Fundidesulfovibrio magnetotacticus]|uniref:histidine kinase n=1 Tax=Fundidesulfovibrio magnetotacticus TaxID=2730080 RepID=A0A6V8LWR1_9BACT|nr:ATP-binding protein [Fundidesulfovibrio magnetotacticus]GFK94519.1 Globin-coupled histidine kinase [Fundidesulfovibrio magnetotacticus]